MKVGRLKQIQRVQQFIIDASQEQNIELRMMFPTLALSNRIVCFLMIVGGYGSGRSGYPGDCCCVLKHEDVEISLASPTFCSRYLLRCSSLTWDIPQNFLPAGQDPRYEGNSWRPEKSADQAKGCSLPSRCDRDREHSSYAIYLGYKDKKRKEARFSHRLRPPAN